MAKKKRIFQRNNNSSKKILILTDSPIFKGGLSRVGRELSTRFHRDGYKVFYAGWGHNPLPHKFPFYITQIMRGHTDEGGWLKTLIEDIKPDIFLCVGDVWYFSFMEELLKNLKFTPPDRWVYLTVDGEPFHPEWIPILQQFTRVYTQSHFASEKIAETNPYFDTKTVWLGVDKKEFFPITPKPSWLKKFVVMVNGFNCSRKNIPASLEAFAKFSSDKEDVLMFLNTQQNSPHGNDLKQMVLKLRLQHKCIFEKTREYMEGVEDMDLNNYYNSANCLLSTTSGEGYGLFVNEGFATKTPVLMTDYSTAEELLGKDRGIRLKVASTFCGGYNINRAMVDINDTAKKLELLYRDWKNGGKLAKEMTEKAYNFVKHLTWEKTYHEILSWGKNEVDWEVI